MRRATLRPARGKCRWLEPAVNGNAQLEINGVAYEVNELPDGDYQLLRINPTSLHGVSCYTIKKFPREVWVCDCPDSANRVERRTCCKHVNALKAAVVRLGLPLTLTPSLRSKFQCLTHSPGFANSPATHSSAASRTV